MAVLRLEGAGRPPATSGPGVVSGVVEGLRFVWGNQVLRTLGLIDLAVTGLYLPMESVLFPGASPTAAARPPGLGLDGAVDRRAGRGAELDGPCRRCPASGRRCLTAVLTFGAAVLVIAFLPPLPVIPGVRGAHRPGVRADRADLQLGDADPRPSTCAAGGRRDDVDGLRRRPARIRPARPVPWWTRSAW